MKVEDVRKRLDTILVMSMDDDAAHGLEDDLYIEVLIAISKGRGRFAELAREALKAQDIDFTRWTA